MIKLTLPWLSRQITFLCKSSKKLTKLKCWVPTNNCDPCLGYSMWDPSPTTKNPLHLLTKQDIMIQSFSMVMQTHSINWISLQSDYESKIRAYLFCSCFSVRKPRDLSVVCVYACTFWFVWSACVHSWNNVATDQAPVNSTSNTWPRLNLANCQTQCGQTPTV